MPGRHVVRKDTGMGFGMMVVGALMLGFGTFAPSFHLAGIGGVERAILVGLGIAGRHRPIRPLSAPGTAARAS